MSEGARRAGVALAVVALAALVIGPDWLAGHLWASADGLTQNLPHRVMAAAALAQGAWPFWNPYFFAGMPFFATLQPGVLFPGNWLFLVVPAVAAQALTLALAIATAIGGTYMFARALALPRLAALFAGTAFGLGGFMVMHLEHVQMVQIAGLLPWLLWAIERHAQARTGRHAVAAALLVALMVLAGSPQLTAYALLVGVAYAIFRALGLPRGERAGFLGAGLLAGGLGVGLSAIQLVPTLDFLGGTQRANMGPYAFAFRALTPEGLVGLVAPYVYGVRQPTGIFATPFWAPMDWEGFQDGYAGMAALLLAAVALGRWRAERQVRFWAGVAIVGLLLALGRTTPLGELVARLPAFNAMRFAHRHLFEVTFAVAMLAGFGLAWLQRAEAGAARARALAAATLALGGVGLALLVGAALFGGRYAARLQPHMPPGWDMAAGLAPAAPAFWTPLALALAAAGLAWALARSGRPAWAAGLVLLLAADLLVHMRLQSWAYRLPPAPAFPLTAPLPERAAGRELTVPAIRYPDCVGCDRWDLLWRLRYPGVSVFQGLATANGYDAFIPARYGRLFGMDSVGLAGELDDALWGPAHHALDLVGCRTVRLDPAVVDTPAWRTRLASGRWRRLPDQDGLVVLANPRAMPLAWRVTRAVTIDAAAVDGRIAGAGPFAPAAEALLDAPTALALPFTPGPVTTTWAAPGQLALATSGAGAGLVVIAEGYDPGWTAWLEAADGARRELAVLRADAVLMAVLVPPGECRVVMTYQPRRWGLGAACSGLAAIGLLGWLWGWRRRGRAAPRG